MISAPNEPAAPLDALAALWRAAELPAEALGSIDLPGTGPVVPSSFPVAIAAQASLAAAALAAVEIDLRRGGVGGARDRVTVDRRHAALEARGWFSLDGRVPEPWDPLSGLYPCGDDGAGGWVRIHANFAHHRDGALRLLGLPPGPGTPRDAVTRALRERDALAFEDAAANAGLVVAAARTFDAWDAHPQGRALAAAPPVCVERIGSAADAAAPRGWPDRPAGAPPLHGLRVLDLTRILAGPVAGRTLAAHGADVVLVNAPHLPNIEAIADTSRGKRSALVDLRGADGRDILRTLLRDAHVFQQGYRPGALAALGFSAEEVARERPGIVVVSLSAYGDAGPWAGRRGFDSLVQTATGFNLAEAQAAGSDVPRALPMQILDYAAGFLMAFGAQAALLRQASDGGSWHVRVSLAATGRWLRCLGRVPGGLATPRPPLTDDLLETSDSGFGRLTAVRHAARLASGRAPALRPSRPPGADAARW
jgi:hypothetical protein